MTSFSPTALISVLSAIFLSKVLGFLPLKVSTRVSRYTGPVAVVDTSGEGQIQSYPSGRWRNYALRYSWGKNDDASVPQDLLNALDLVQIIEGVAKHTATRRGYTALLSTIQRSPVKATQFPESNRQQRLYERTESRRKTRPSDLTPVATNLEEVQSEYALVEEAALLIAPKENTEAKINGDDFYSNLPNFPPLYGKERSPLDTDTIPETDDDEWLDLAPEQFTAEHILQAEQVMKMLLNIHQWSQQEKTQTWTPTLAQIGSTIDQEENILPSVYDDIAGNIEIVRTKSFSDSSKASYSIRVKDDRFPILQLLNEKEEKLLKKGAKELDKELVSIRSEIEATTAQILSSMAQKILSASASLDHGLEVAARLDILMAKAAYTSSLNGVVPIVKTGGEILIENFLHPVLLTTMDGSEVVPIDLRLSSDSGESALVISGPNGGGKTLSMKSFGLVSMLTKLGIPIPVREGSKTPRVDYFDEIFVNVGDKQSVLDGESTWTSILNSCATMIQTIAERREVGADPSILVLLDELGTGTDPESGGAVAQAILEELVANSCKIVVTTHLPRLKTLSYNDDQIGCAAVLLDYSDYSTFKRPSFKLEYGLIGESHALNAASRCVPSLPDHVLSRASDLLNEGADMSEENTTQSSYIQALTSSMEEQLERSRIATSSIEKDANDSSKCRQAMVSLASAYACDLDRKLDYLEATFQKLKADGKSEYELLGETLSELKAVKKKIMSQEEKLALKGLKTLSTTCALSPGESVIIISLGELEGVTAVVVEDGLNSKNSLDANQVLVKPSFSSLDLNDVVRANIDPMNDRPLILQRQDIAVWDFDSIYDDDTFQAKPATSISNSKQKVNSLLSTLDSVSKKKKPSNSSPKKKGGGNKFQSSRQRKAANKGKKKKGR